MQQIDADIIRRCKAGDKTAFRSVVQNCQGMVYSLSLKMLVDVEEAKDVVQDTFIKVWQNIGSYDDRYGFNTWVYTIASRLCLDRLRKIRPIGPMDDDKRVFESIADDTDPEHQLESSEWV